MKKAVSPFILVGYISILVFLVYWGYNHSFWTQCDPTLVPQNEQASYDAFGLYTYAKVVHREHIHPQRVFSTLWGELPFYVYSMGIGVFGERFSSIREVFALFSGLWGAVIFLIVWLATKRPTLSFFVALIFIPFSGHVNFHANRGYAHFYTFIFQALSLYFMLLYSKRKRRWLLAAVGLIQGISFGFKYELSLLGLSAALMVLYALETVEAYNYVITESGHIGCGLKYRALRIAKFLSLFLVFVASFYFVRLGFLSYLLLVFWIGCFAMLLFELRLMRAIRQQPDKPGAPGRPYNGISGLGKDIFALVAPFALVIVLLFVHMWQATNFEVARNYFIQLTNTSSQIAQMNLSSLANQADYNLMYFLSSHPFTLPQIVTWFFGAFLAYWVLFFIKDMISRGILIGFSLFAVFAVLKIDQIYILSMFYFISAVSLLLWAYFLDLVRRSEIKRLPPELIVYLCFMAVGSLSLLRESASFDLNIWSMLPALIGSLAFVVYSPSIGSNKSTYLKTMCLAAVFYFAAVAWFQIEAVNMVFYRFMPQGRLMAIDREFDLLIPKETAVPLREMKEYFQANLGKDEYIFIFSDHIYPYIFTPGGLPCEYLASFQVPDKKREDRMLLLLRTKKIKYVLFSCGMAAYNSELAARNYPKLYDFISKNYVKTDKQFLNFVVYRNTNT